jgi:NAD(P)-dependent dehydrogenase (short-subunit alcohol dehydrogenase family)
MPAQDLSGTTALVTGASRGFGRAIAIAIALTKHGAHVVGVTRDRGRLEELRAQLGGTFTPVAADASDPVAAGQLLDTHRPRTLVLNAGAAPLPRPIHRQTWQTFSRNCDVDVQHVFNWTREALLLPLQPGSAVVAFSSGAAVNGSPLSGSYAGAKATIRFIASYATEEASRNGLGIRFISVLPQPTPELTPTCSPLPASARCRPRACRCSRPRSPVPRDPPRDDATHERAEHAPACSCRHRPQDRAPLHGASRRRER